MRRIRLHQQRYSSEANVLKNVDAEVLKNGPNTGDEKLTWTDTHAEIHRTTVVSNIGV